MTEHTPKSGASRAVEFDPFAGAAIQSSFPTTEPQKEVWLSSQLGPDASCSYNESIVLELTGEFSAAAFEHALHDVVMRHDALRATVSADGESLMIAEQSTIDPTFADWRGLDAKSQEEEMRKLRLSEVTTPFDLLNGPLIRARVVRRSDDRHDVIISAHHIICDGWSFEPLLGDLSRAYSARVAGTVAELPPADSFQVYVTRHSDPEYADEIRESGDYWLQRFRSIPPQSEFTPDKPRPRERSFEADCLLHPLPMALVAKLREVGSTHRCSLMTMLLCAFEVFVSRLTGLTDLVTGVPSAGQLAFDCPRLVGHCVNLLPMRTHIEQTLTFAEYLDSRRSQVLADFDHQKFTYGSLVKALPLQRDVSRMPLTSLMFNIDQPLEGIEFDGLRSKIRSNPRRYDAFEQFFNLTMEEDSATIECQYNTNLFSEPLMRHRLESFQNLLEEIASDPGQRIDRIDLLSDRQRELVTRSWAEGPALELSYASFVDGFRAAGAAAPDRTACEFGETATSYAALDALTDRVAAGLAGKGIGRGDRVGIMLRRSDRLLFSILGILKAGAAYVPLDPAFPAERLAFIIEDADLALVLGDAGGAPGEVPSADRIAFDELLDAGSDAPGAAPAPVPAPAPADSAYLIYTSGSTGKPKGVEVDHRNLVNFLCSMIRTPGLDETRRLFAVTSPSFDISILELLGPLMAGGTVIIADDDTVKDGTRLKQQLEESAANCMQATPSTWRMLKEVDWRGGAGFLALCGGEALDGDLADWLADGCGDAWNMYGPTETTIWSTSRRLVRGSRPVTLGNAIHNTQIRVLDAAGQPVPPGTFGELYIGGYGVAKGYWQRPDLTGSRFRTNVTGAGRAYATGDSVRYLANGELEYGGRLDNQVKLHGYRIELGDIEAALQRFEGVEQAVAAARDFAAGDTRLVAYLRMRAGSSLDVVKAREFLATILPAYMVPNHLVEVSAFPMTPNRKIDRRSLPMPDTRARETVAADHALQGETQQAVAAIWKDVLGVEDVGRRDDFFHLGGHSILVTRVLALIRSDIGADLPLRRFFEAPVLEDVADAIDALRLLARGNGVRPIDGELEEIEI